MQSNTIYSVFLQAHAHSPIAFWSAVLPLVWYVVGVLLLLPAMWNKYPPYHAGGRRTVLHWIAAYIFSPLVALPMLLLLTVLITRDKIKQKKRGLNEFNH